MNRFLYPSKLYNGSICRERWKNHLNLDKKRSPWSTLEESVMLKAHRVYGNSWTQIATFLHGRDETYIKNRFYTNMRATMMRIKAMNVLGTNSRHKLTLEGTLYYIDFILREMTARNDQSASNITQQRPSYVASRAASMGITVQ